MDPRAPLTVDQVAQLLDCSADTVRELARKGALAGLKPGRDWIFPAGALYARLDEMAIAEAAERRTPTTPSATLHALPGTQQAKKARRPPPTLPAVG